MKSFISYINEEKQMAASSISGLDLAETIKKLGFKIKSATNTAITVLVTGNRLEQMSELAKSLKNMGAVIDSSMKGSSIGGIKVQNVRIMIKADGRTGGLDVEAKAIEDLNDAVAIAMIATGGPITVKLKGRTVKGVVGVEKTAGTPKSDFHLIDENNKPLVHISHKKGSKPNDFQQWGGVTEARILKHKEVQQFALLCKSKFGDRIPNGTSVYTKIKDKDLKMMSVFGVEFDAAGVNVNKVDVLLQGDPGLKELSEGVFELTATGHVHYYGEVPDGGFEPVLAAIYKGDRDQLGIKGARFSIYPLAGRKMTDIKDWKK